MTGAEASPKAVAKEKGLQGKKLSALAEREWFFPLIFYQLGSTIATKGRLNLQKAI